MATHPLTSTPPLLIEASLHVVECAAVTTVVCRTDVEQAMAVWSTLTLWSVQDVVVSVYLLSLLPIKEIHVIVGY